MKDDERWIWLPCVSIIGCFPSVWWPVTRLFGDNRTLSECWTWVVASTVLREVMDKKTQQNKERHSCGYGCTTLQPGVDQLLESVLHISMLARTILKQTSVVVNMGSFVNGPPATQKWLLTTIYGRTFVGEHPQKCRRWNAEICVPQNYIGTGH